ncbi:uncharacterized protein LOC106994744 [Macaca mulatta]
MRPPSGSLPQNRTPQTPSLPFRFPVELGSKRDLDTQVGRLHHVAVAGEPRMGPGQAPAERALPCTPPPASRTQPPCWGPRALWSSLRKRSAKIPGLQGLLWHTHRVTLLEPQPYEPIPSLLTHREASHTLGGCWKATRAG